MHPDFQELMAKATQLTRAGRLQEATAVIQTALASAGHTAAAPVASAPGAFSSPTGPSGTAADASEICGGMLRGNVGFGPATTGMRSIENFTSSAVKSEPSWNLMFGCRVKR